MTAEEREDKTQQWLANNPSPGSAFELDLENLTWRNTKPYPTDDHIYYWDDAQQDWVQFKPPAWTPSDFPDTPTDLGPVKTSYIANLNSESDLPKSYAGNRGDAFLILQTRDAWSWTGTDWVWLTKIENIPLLQDLVIIPAFVNGQEAKILGVLNSIIDLEPSYQGDTGDSYIIKEWNEVWGWNGQNWMKAEIIWDDVKSLPSMI
jgi:hypothetical protein